MSGVTPGVRRRARAGLVAAVGLAATSPLVASPGASAQSVPSMEAAAARYREVAAFCADFEQTIVVRLVRRTIASAGRLCQQRPNLFSMRFSQPDGDLVVSDGEHFWVYYPSVDAEQVMRRPVSGSPGGEDFIRELLEDPGARYDAEETGREAVDGRDCQLVELTPLQPGHYTRARVWLDVASHLVRRVEIHEQSGNVRTVTLRDIDLVPTLDPALFTFEPPPGARVTG